MHSDTFTVEAIRLGRSQRRPKKAESLDFLEGKFAQILCNYILSWHLASQLSNHFPENGFKILSGEATLIFASSIHTWLKVAFLTVIYDFT